jgi:hypothetical protein
MFALCSSIFAQDLTLKIEPPTESIHVGDHSNFTVTINNQGEKPVTLVEPGDGSDCKWRTPVIGWSVISNNNSEAKHPEEPPLFHGGRCGNINAPSLKEVFTLKPKESKKFNSWVGAPTFTTSGKFRVVFYYQNIPNLKTSGLSVGKDKQGVIEKIEKSEACKLISNELLVEVLQKK